MEKSIKEKLRELLSHKQSKHYYASKLGISERLVERLLYEVREEDRGAIVDPGEEKIKLVSEKRNEEGDREVQYLSVKPLDRKEIEELYGIDGINTRLSSYWNKQTPSGKYLVSAFVKCLVSDFYTKEELEKQLKEVFPNLKPVSLKVVPSTSSKALFIYISDDHCGNVIKNSIYGKEYSEHIYVKRLLALSNEVKKLDQEFDEAFIINMGDEADGWNGKTTRYDHDLVDSLSNKDQFNIYTTGRRIFYDDILTSGVAPKYTIISLNNSNHCFPDYVEVLTNNGFKYINDVTDNDLIGSIDNNRSISYDKPIQKIYNKDIATVLHKYKSKNIQIDVTSEHRMRYKDPKKGDWRYKLSKDLKDRKSVFLFQQSGENNNPDYEISDDIIKLAAWIASDGSVRKGHEYIIHQREEKCHYIKEILDSLNVGYDERLVDYREPTTEIQGVKLKSIPKTMKRFHLNRNFTSMNFLLKLRELVPEKYNLPTWLNSLSKRQFDLYLDTFILGDGSRKDDSEYDINSACIYGTHHVLSQLQKLCIQNGHRARLKEYREGDFILLITFNTISSLIDPYREEVKEEYYEGDTWCFTMPKGNLIVRQNGFISIQGNSGKGLSYILNKSMEFYLQARYDNVSVINLERFIDTIKYGNHIIGLTHGKDEQLMKAPLPLNLDAKTDLWLFEYYDKLGYSPSKHFTSTMKGDIHKFNINSGKSGRYINCPSIAGGSGWIELNFGDTKAGALLEIVEKDNPNIITLPIWFN